MFCRLCLALLSMMFAAQGASAAECPIQRTDNIVLLRAKSGERQVSFCIHRGAPPNLIETRDADGKLMLSSQYDGMKALLTLNVSAGVKVAFDYQDVTGNPSHVGVGEKSTFRQITIGSHNPPAQVDMRGVSASKRTIDACTFDVIRLQRVNRNPDGSGMEFDIFYAPELGWPLESSGRLLTGAPASQMVVQHIASAAEAQIECNR